MNNPTTMACLVCNTDNPVAFKNILLNQHEVSYFYCQNCGLLHTEEPYWLEQAYSHAIAGADTGIVMRNQMVADRAAAALFLMFRGDGKFLDLAGGTGLLVRMMRDRGFDFYWDDKFCDNVLARGFEHQENSSYRALTAVEVMEHLPRPLEFIVEALETYRCQTLVFTTELFAGGPPTPDWHYFASAEGQHITFYQRRTFEYIADQLGLNFYSRGGLHFLTNQQLSDSDLKKIRRDKLRAKVLANVEKALVSKVQSDHQLMLTAAQASPALRTL